MPVYTGASGGMFGGTAGRRISPPSRMGPTKGPLSLSKSSTSASPDPLNPSTIPQLPYQPEAPRASGMVDKLSGFGGELMDPGGAYSQRLKEELTKGIGQQSAAQNRSAMLRAARSDMGTGASPELMEMQGDISRAGLSAAGDASAEAQLRFPQMGLDALSRALSGEIGLQGQRLSGFMGQQQLQQADRESMIREQLERDRMAQEAMWREMALLF